MKLQLHLAAVICMLAAATAVSADTLYQTISTGYPSGAGQALCWDINNSGMMAVEANVSGHSVAYVWDKDHGYRALGSLGGLHTIAYGINDNGQVVGRADLPPYTGSRGFIWDETNGFRELSNLDNIYISTPKAINNRGEIAGYTSDNAFHPCWWNAQHEITELAPRSVIRQGMSNAINNNGVIVGDATFVATSTSRHAFIWDEVNGIRDLDTFGYDEVYGYFSTATGINDLGQVVGYYGGASLGFRSFVWDAVNGMRDLGSFGEYTYAYGINNFGQVIGRSGISSINTHPYIWDTENGMRDLSELGVNGAVQAINDYGVIAGWARIDGAQYAGGAYYVPVPEPSSVLVLAALVGCTSSRVCRSCFKRSRGR